MIEKEDIEIKLKNGKTMKFFHDTNERMSYQEFEAIYGRKVESMAKAAKSLGLKKLKK